MYYEESIRAAARLAADAANSTIGAYVDGEVTDEDDMTGAFFGALRQNLKGTIEGLSWSASVIRHRRGKADVEGKIGADLLIHVAFRTPQLSYSKGVLIQAKRVEPDVAMSQNEHERLIDQCNKMLAVTPDSFVFDYAKRGMRCASANLIRGTTTRDLHEQCPWTAYRFFLELFRCNVGDPGITSSKPELLTVPNAVKIIAKPPVG